MKRSQFKIEKERDEYYLSMRVPGFRDQTIQRVAITKQLAKRLIKHIKTTERNNEFIDEMISSMKKYTNIFPIYANEIVDHLYKLGQESKQEVIKSYENVLKIEKEKNDNFLSEINNYLIGLGFLAPENMLLYQKINEIFQSGKALGVSKARELEMKDNSEKNVASLVIKELRKANNQHGGFNSAHEGFAVLKEEVDELWESIKENKPSTEEAIQVAAMGMKLAMLIMFLNENRLGEEQK